MEFLKYSLFTAVLLTQVVFGQIEDHFCGRLNYTAEELVKEPKKNIPWGAFVTKTSDPPSAIPCAAIIIAPTILLTRANCFYDDNYRHLNVLRNPSSYTAFVDSPYFSSATANGQKIPVSHISVHFHFGTKFSASDRLFQGKDVMNDFALVHLSSPIKFSDLVHPICLPSLEDNPDLMDPHGMDSLILFGWASEHLTEIYGMRFETQSRGTCHHGWDPQNIPEYRKNNFCAVVVEPNKIKCCVTYGIGSFYPKNGQYYLGGQTNNYFGYFSGICSRGSVYYFSSLTDETLFWIENSKKCGSNNFTCFTDGKCIPKSKLCDGQFDCKDLSDEWKEYCVNRIPCPEDDFQCKMYETCIPRSKLNDGIFDCPGGEDELTLGKDPTISSTDFNSNYIIAGFSGGLFILGSILIALVFACAKRRSAHVYRKERDLTEEEMDEFLNGISNKSTQNSSSFVLNDSYRKSLGYYPAYTNNYLLNQAWNTMYEIPITDLQIGRELNRGGFGVIKKATLTKTDKVDGTVRTMEVAVKAPLGSMDVEKFKNLLREIKISSHIGSHDCVVEFLGACTEDIKRRKVFLVVELCENGDLLTFLKSLNKQDILAVYNSKNDNPTCSITRNQCNLELSILLKWSRQIASGMAHLGRRNVIHGDIAARNILLTNTFDAKISDFGLSRELNNTETYIKATREPLPWKWLSPESLTENIFSNKSDVWSYGVTLWEIFSLGEVPYGNIRYGYNFILGLQNGTVLQKPEFASQDIYEVMLNTWSYNPEDRFTFEELESKFTNLQRNLNPL